MILQNQCHYWLLLVKVLIKSLAGHGLVMKMGHFTW